MLAALTDENGTPQEMGLEQGSTVNLTEITSSSELCISITFNGVTEEYELNPVAGGPLLRPRVPR